MSKAAAFSLFIQMILSRVGERKIELDPGDDYKRKREAKKKKNGKMEKTGNRLARRVRVLKGRKRISELSNLPCAAGVLRLRRSHPQSPPPGITCELDTSPPSIGMDVVCSCPLGWLAPLCAYSFNLNAVSYSLINQAERMCPQTPIRLYFHFLCRSYLSLW